MTPYQLTNQMSSNDYTPNTGQTLAALDLGSNSFHMVIAEQDELGGVQFIDRVKDMVRLNAGLDNDGNLSEESQARALECLERFSQRLRHIPASQVRAVGTNTFRAAHNGAAFLARAEEVLGHHISIISGHEEARLVYLGAAFSLESSGKQRLVIDIGGGSTELIVGKGHQAMAMSSFGDRPLTLYPTLPLLHCGGGLPLLPTAYTPHFEWLCHTASPSPLGRVT